MMMDFCCREMVFRYARKDLIDTMIVSLHYAHAALSLRRTEMASIYGDIGRASLKLLMSYRHNTRYCCHKINAS